jgi:uncharacterized membrane protein YgcG
VSGPIPIHPDDEERIASSMSRDLEAVAAESAIRPPVGFADRVMAAVAAEPLPQPARAFRVALVAGRFRAATASVADAWRVVVGGSTPLGVRAQALALVLVVAIGSLAVAGGAAVGAIDVLNANHGLVPSPTMPPPSQLSSPQPTPSPSLTPDPAFTPEATETTEPTETPRATQRTGGGGAVQPTPTDDHGGGGGGGGDDSGHDESSSGSGSGGDSHTQTPQPTETHEPDGGDG